jgi:hypothetical protein
MSELEIALAGLDSPVLRCSANFRHDKSDIATSLLLVSVHDKKCLIAYPRCSEHPAETYLRLVGIIHPGEFSCVIPLVDRAKVMAHWEEA